MPVTGRARNRCGARFGSVPMAGSARIHCGNAYLGFRAASCLLQRDLQVIAQVGTSIDIGMPTATAEKIAEDIAKRIGKTLGIRAGHARVHAGMAMLVIGTALPRI